MPYYHRLKYLAKDMRERTLSSLKRLRSQLAEEMPVNTRSKTLVLGTWNIRNFDDNRFKHGPRAKEDFYYLAEIISHFDILAVQEICEDMSPLKQIIDLLGDQYKYIVTDLTEGRAGNSERLGFIYDTTKVWFKGVAGELVLDDKSLIADGDLYRQFSRTPFMCEFQSGWFKFMFSTVHIYFGSDSGQAYERRVSEINAVAKFLKRRASRDALKKNGKSINHVLVGDFNIKEKGSKGYNALASQGFEVFDNKIGSNQNETRFYDQISFLPNPHELKLAKSEKNHGVFQFFKSIYRDEDFPTYKTEVAKTVKARIDERKAALEKNKKGLEKADTESKIKSATDKIKKDQAFIAEWSETLEDDSKLKAYYTKEWRTFRASDHLPLWVELEIDFSDAYLDHL